MRPLHPRIIREDLINPLLAEPRTRSIHRMRTEHAERQVQEVRDAAEEAVFLVSSVLGEVGGPGFHFRGVGVEGGVGAGGGAAGWLGGFGGAVAGEGAGGAFH
ncbi:hypothetical protein V502_09881 [Pseudogymnoascus sp. VKM F-4520 (FW-2644)]|nr:hypothetical protein V502_09881 [Pseudogymnoascus sp. VKM F-4520 (FW-2644)]